jgi:multiple sugar transport system substrate-binding protein
VRASRLALVAGIAIAGMSLAACSSGGSGGSSDSSDNSTGPITYVQGKDNNNIVRPLIDQWNQAHPKETVTFKEQSDQADQQHDDLVQHFQAKSADYDVVDVDVVWTAEFAAKGWLAPLKGDLAIDTSKLLPATVKTATYNNTLYAAPQASDGGLLYYRSDLIQTPPTSWDEMMSDCSVAKSAGIGCYAGQFAQYEGLTVNVSEAINGAGGTVVDSSGKPTLTTDAADKGGNIPAEAITYQEEQGRQAFEAGKLLFLRNWPYMYSLASTDSSSVVQGKFKVAPLVSASTLGGHNAAISTYSKHKATALAFVKFLESEETQKYFAQKGSLAPVLASLYDDPTLVSQLPYLPTLKQSILKAVPRPVTPYYPAVTKAIEDNSFAALKGTTDPKTALSNMQKAIQAASAG